MNAKKNHPPDVMDEINAETYTTIKRLSKSEKQLRAKRARLQREIDAMLEKAAEHTPETAFTRFTRSLGHWRDASARWGKAYSKAFADLNAHREKFAQLLPDALDEINEWAAENDRLQAVVDVCKDKLKEADLMINHFTLQLHNTREVNPERQRLLMRRDTLKAEYASMNWRERIATDRAEEILDELGEITRLLAGTYSDSPLMPYDASLNSNPIAGSANPPS